MPSACHVPLAICPLHSSTTLRDTGRSLDTQRHTSLRTNRTLAAHSSDISATVLAWPHIAHSTLHRILAHPSTPHFHLPSYISSAHWSTLIQRDTRCFSSPAFQWRPCCDPLGFTSSSRPSVAMSRHFLVALVACLLSLVLSASGLSPVIVEDNFSNAVFLPFASSDAQLGFSIDQPAIDLSPYTLTVHSLTAATSFYVNDAFGQATLDSSSAALGSASEPIKGVGSYAYSFSIPSSGRLLFNCSYSTGAEHVQVLISASNPHAQD